MNRITASIEAIEQEGRLSIIHLKSERISLRSIILDNSNTADYLKVGNKISALFKEHEVIISKQFLLNNISIQNHIPCTISKIRKGALLSELHLEATCGNLTAMINSNALEQMNLKIADKVFAYVKTSEIILEA